MEIPWKWDEMEASAAETNRYIDSVSYKVDSILDVTHMGAIPKEGLSRSIQVGKKSHPRTGRIVLVGGNMTVQMMVNAVSRIVGRVSRNAQPIIFAASIEEAYKLLKPPDNLLFSDK